MRGCARRRALVNDPRAPQPWGPPWGGVAGRAVDKYENFAAPVGDAL